MAEAHNTVTHFGSCHCESVKFEFDASPDLVAWDCNCSICNMKRNTHAIIPKANFRITAGEDALTCYQFGTKTARHLFCSKCGICPFYVPRSNPDGFAVTIWCIQPGTVRSIDVRKFGGTAWEEAYASTGISACTPAKSGGGTGGGGGGSGGGAV